ncbi:dihydrofolate reductase family protein [Agromyces sp. NPDC058484]|uniref:dihydrofolate reductase family protein n=1 Tax=Agromyces sp. NPDC058484 TaxID=3346524 RepID=UPI003652ABA0
MGIIAVDLFITLDGVYQAPGGRDEDREDGFEFGGWQAPYFDDESGASIGAGIDRLQALLLGHKTYDIFAAYWPAAGVDEVPEIAAKFNQVPKFVASHTLTDPSWEGTTVITDVAAEVRALRDRFDEIHVIGSGDLVQTLLAEDLVDRLNLWVYPVTFGAGKRLFGDRTIPAAFRLAEPPTAFPKGAVSLVYERAGEPVTGIDITA